MNENENVETIAVLELINGKTIVGIWDTTSSKACLLKPAYVFVNYTQPGQPPTMSIAPFAPFVEQSDENPMVWTIPDAHVLYCMVANEELKDFYTQAIINRVKTQKPSAIITPKKSQIII